MGGYPSTRNGGAVKAKKIDKLFLAALFYDDEHLWRVRMVTRHRQAAHPH